MKFSTLIASFSLVGFCFAANAAVSDNLAIYATEKENGSMYIAGKSAYTKTFDVTVAKLPGGSDVDLSKLCLKAYSPDNKAFTLDTVDEELTTGTLKDGKMVKGTAVFASESEDILKAAMVKISDNCK
ncbi:DUF4354 family protein [Serratia marcescens]|uniref:DUF4354 family protein n=1 Tax=Serratia marcescens TaxID=615 RepID=UPI003F83F16F